MLVPLAAGAALVLLVALLHLFLRGWRKVTRLQYPPGPKADPIIGNLRQIPTENQPQAFLNWKKLYGDITYVNVLGKSILVLNSLKAAQDLLIKRGDNFSDRPRMVLLSELMGWDMVITHMSYGPKFLRHRQFIQEYFKAPAIREFHSLMEQERLTLVRGLAKDPAAWLKHIQRFTASTILRVTYGHEVYRLDDEYIQLVNEVTSATIQTGAHGSTLVDIFPFLRYLPTWMPGTGLHKAAAEVKQQLRVLMDMPYDNVKRQMDSGAGVACFTSDLVLRYTRAGAISPEIEFDIKGAAGVLYAAGSETTTGTLETFFLAMTIYPEYYRKAQQEVDRIMTTDRLPILQDKASLPYVEALLMEVLRWSPPVALGIPHASVADDDTYRGYHIPKKTMVIPNIWAYSRNTEVYPNPEKFDPERFLNEDGTINKKNDPRSYVFGFGRRVCPGQHFAEANLWLAMSAIIASFDILKPVDGHGKEYTPEPLFTQGMTTHPAEFSCRIVPRNKP